jgi:uncharacterized membrane protein YphA (DoxX/SURF4 family)
MQLTSRVYLRLVPVNGRRLPWASVVSAAAGAVLGTLFLASGAWKMSDLPAAAERMVQTLVPVQLSLPLAFTVAVSEMAAGVLLFVPRYRRWGAWSAGLLLIAFMIYIGVMYDQLLGEDCNCFPWVRRVVGPAFFAGDAAMLGLAAIAGWWSATPRPGDWRRAVGILCAAGLLGTGAYAGESIRSAGAEVPATASIDDPSFTLRHGRILLYFFDPECTHCYTVARAMSRRDWGATRIVVVPIRESQFAASFLTDTGLRAAVSRDGEALRRVFAFTEPPYAVALEDGRAVARFNSGQMENGSWSATLADLGYLR